MYLLARGHGARGLNHGLDGAAQAAAGHGGELGWRRHDEKVAEAQHLQRQNARVPLARVCERDSDRGGLSVNHACTNMCG